MNLLHRNLIDCVMCEAIFNIISLMSRSQCTLPCFPGVPILSVNRRKKKENKQQEGHDGPEIAHLSLLTKHAPSSFPVT